jgi:hypothetical protein
VDWVNCTNPGDGNALFSEHCGRENERRQLPPIGRELPVCIPNQIAAAKVLRLYFHPCRFMNPPEKLDASRVSSLYNTAKVKAGSIPRLI